MSKMGILPSRQILYLWKKNQLSLIILVFKYILMHIVNSKVGCGLFQVGIIATTYSESKFDYNHTLYVLNSYP